MCSFRYKSVEVQRSKIIVTCSCDEKNLSDHVVFLTEFQLFKVQAKSGEVYTYIDLSFTNTHHWQSQLQKIKTGKRSRR